MRNPILAPFISLCFYCLCWRADFCKWPAALRNRIGAEGQEKSGKQIRLSRLPTHMARDEFLRLGLLGQGKFGEMPALVAQVWNFDALQAEQNR